MIVRRKFSSLAIVLAMVVGIMAQAIPANARPVPGTASVDIKNVIAGTERTFLFTVSNGGSAGTLGLIEPDPTINYVRIGSDTPGAFTISNGTAGGWNFDLDSEGNARFRGGALEPGDSFQFTLAATSLVPAQDVAGDWVVEVSDNNGQNIVRQSPASAGALTTTVRVLSVDAVAPTGPSGVLDGTATANQTGLTYQSLVTNHGSADLSVTGTLASSGGDTISSPPAATIVSGSSLPYDFGVDLGGAGTRQFTADATATGANALDLTSGNLVVQTPAAFTYVGGSLSPVASSSGVDRTFTLAVNKTNPPSVTFDFAQTTLTFTKQGDPSQTFQTLLSSAPATGNGTQNVGLTFGPVTIPAGSDVDGFWVPSLTLVGTDDNGAPVSRTVSVGNNFEIDNLIPVLVPTLSAPMGQVNPADQPVVRNGNTLTFGGTVKKGPGDSAPADTTSTLTDCDLVVTDGDFIELGRIDVPLTNCTNNNGNISGSLAPADLLTDAGFVRLEVAAQDPAGNAAPLTPSNFVAVDNVVPGLDRAVTGCGGVGTALDATCDDFTTIRVFLSEHVKGGSTLPLDYTVMDNLVTNVTMADSRDPSTACTSAQFCDVAVLTLAQAIGEDDTPSVVYEFLNVPVTLPVAVRTRPTDGPKHSLADGAVDAIDGIVPDLPSLGGVSQSGLDDEGGTTNEFAGEQNGAYYTNQTAPTYRITGLALGYTGIVAIDNDGDGYYDEDIDTEIASCLADGASVDCEGSTLATNTAYDVLVTSLDADGNLAKGRSGALAGKTGRPATLVIDQIAPAADSYLNEVATRTVAVSLTEPLAQGRDFAEDWFAYVFSGGFKRRMVVSEVDGSGATRAVHIDDTEPRWGATGAEELRYSYNGLPSARYRDRAGNYLTDFTLTS